MNQIFENNLAQLEQNHPRLSQDLRHFSTTSDRFRCQLAKNGAFSFQVNENNSWKNIVSKYDPGKEAITQVENQWQENAEAVIVLGVGGFYHVEEIFNRISEDCVVIVVGQDMELFYEVICHRDLTHVLADPRLLLSIGDPIDTVYKKFRMLSERDEYDLPNISIIEQPSECRLYQEFYKLCKKRFVDAYHQGLANVSTKLYFGEQLMKNLLANLPDILTARKFDALAEAFAGRPGILVSAGPSLNKNIQLLKEIGNKCLIVCVDTAYRALKKEGIVPHLIVAVDGGELNYRHFEGIDYSEIPMIMDVTVHEQIASNHQGIKYVTQASGLPHWLGHAIGHTDLVHIPTGGSVATSAFALLEFFGCDPIIFVGQDLSFPGGKVYATGTKFADRDITNVERELIPVKDIYGNEVFTTNDYLLYLKWFEAQMQNKKRRFINATEGGALREHVEILSLRQALDQYCQTEFSIDEILRSIPKAEVSQQTIQKGLRKLKQTESQLRRMETQFDNLTVATQELITILEAEQLDDSQTVAVQGIVERATKAEKRIERCKLGLMFTDDIAYREVFRDIHLQEKLEDEELTPKEKDIVSCKQSLIFSSAMKALCQRSIEMMETYIPQYVEKLCR